MGRTTDLTLLRTGLPHWLVPKRTSALAPLSDADLDFVFDKMIEGHTVSSILRENPGLPDYARFMRYVMSDPKLEDQYYEAKRIQTEVYGEKVVEAIEGVNGSDLPEEVARSKVKLDGYRWLMAVNNKKRYGDSKAISISGQIDIGAAMAKGEARVARGVTVDHED